MLQCTKRGRNGRDGFRRPPAGAIIRPAASQLDLLESEQTTEEWSQV
jgi:hypothetical protein